MNIAFHQSAASFSLIFKFKRYTILNNVNTQLSAEYKSFDAFAFLYGTRFCIVPIDSIGHTFKLYDNFDYIENDINMPLNGMLKSDQIYVVKVKADIKDNYTLDSIKRYCIKDLKERIGLGEIKDVFKECLDKYFEQRQKEYLKEVEKYFPF